MNSTPRRAAGTGPSCKVQSSSVPKINRRIVEEAWEARAKGVRQVIRDEACRGLALVVNPTGMSWRFDYRPRGIDPATKRRWSNSSVQLGDAMTTSADAARRLATALKGHVAGGRDPAQERRRDVAQAQQRRAATLGRLLDEYADVLPRRGKLNGSGLASPAHIAGELRALRKALDEMDAAKLPVAELDPDTIRALLLRHAAQPAAARARFGALSRFCDWLVDGKHISANPCARITRAGRPKPPAARTHCLKVAELANLWTAAAELPPLHRDFLRLLIAVPCRRGEAATLDWGHLDLCAGVWNQPGRLTKNRTAHVFYLHPLILTLLQARHADAGRPASGPVFSAPRTGRPLTTWRRGKEDLDKAAGLTGWRLHDTRRSFATAAAEAGVKEVVADAVLNHRQSATRGGVLGVYQTAARVEEQRAAMEIWGALLAAALRRAVFRRRVRRPRSAGAAPRA